MIQRVISVTASVCSGGNPQERRTKAICLLCLMALGASARESKALGGFGSHESILPWLEREFLRGKAGAGQGE